jgi:hypothetical protein
MRPPEIALLLPEVYRTGLGEDGALDALLEVMSKLHGSLEDAIAEPAMLVDPRRAPDRLTPILASWVGLRRYLDTEGDPLGDRPDPGDLRELAVIGAELGRRRGSSDSLRLFLETATGTGGFAISEDAARPFHFRVTLPAAARSRKDLILKIIAAEKPAFATFDLIENPPTT